MARINNGQFYYSPRFPIDTLRIGRYNTYMKTTMCKTDRKSVVMARLSLLRAMSAVIPKTIPHWCDCGSCSTPDELTQQIQYAAIFKAVKNNTKRHYLANSDDNPGRQVSYAQSAKHKYNAEKRTKTTLGRYLTRNKLTGEMTENQVNLYCQKIGAILHNGTTGFATITGQLIVDFYRNVNIPGSCMCGDAADYTQLYAENPNKVSMLTFDDNGLQGRALLWHAEGGKLMDRVYPNDGWHIALFHKWARKNGYRIRASNSLPNGSVDFIDSDDNNSSDFRIELSHKGIIPYFDSFHMGEYDDDTLYLSTDSGEHDFESTDGSLPDGTCCENCNQNIADDEQYFADDQTLCACCYHENYSDCNRCSDTTHNDYTHEVQGEYWCQHCADNYSTNCYQCGNSFCDSEPLTVTKDTSDHYCSDCSENLTNCSDCGKSYADSDNLHTRDDELVCSNCHTEKETSTI